METEERINERGNKVINKSSIYDSRYAYDFDICKPEDGWEQFDTSQDASYFGVWVNKKKLTTVTYVEGDEITVVCLDADHYNAEIADMCQFYEAGFIAIALDLNKGTSTRYVQDRQQFFIGGTDESNPDQDNQRREGD